MQTGAATHLNASSHYASNDRFGREGIYCDGSVAFYEYCFLLSLCILADSGVFSYIETISHIKAVNESDSDR